jgi:hypothetical protein
MSEFDMIGKTIGTKRTGSGWVRTADQGLMSPLLYH